MSQDIEVLVTQYDAKRTERLAADKVAEALATEEATLKQCLINALNEQSLHVAGNAMVMFTLRKKTRYQATDWPTVYRYVAQNDAWDLLQRRLSDTAIIERGGSIPGTEPYEYDDLSRPQKVR